MSALEITPISRRRRLTAESYQPCDNGCMAVAGDGRTMRREATHRATLCGYKAGWLCGACARSWARLWAESHDEQVAA